MWAVFIHVLLVFVAFALTVGVGIAHGAIMHSADVRAIRAATRVVTPLQITGGLLLLLGAVSGMFAASRLGFDLHARWIVVSIVLVALLLLDGFARRWSNLRKITKAASASPDGAPSAELRALIDDRFETIMNPIGGLIWITLIIMMTVKP